MILHILRKDLRRQWREIAGFLLVTCQWVWEQAHPDSWMWHNQRNFIPLVFFGLWLFIVIRAIQGECLVGDREFWTTRPYRWWHLISAKALLCMVVLNGPTLLAETYLLIHAGIPLSWTVAAGLLLLDFQLFLIATFPAAAVAAVTSSLVQWVLAVVGMILFAIVLTWLPWEHLPVSLTGEENVATGIGAAVILCALLFLLIWQYARREVLAARMALLFSVLTVPVCILAAYSPMVHSMAYPVQRGSRFQITVRSDSDGSRSYTRKVRQHLDPTLEIPVVAVPVDPHEVMNVEGMKVVLSGDNGWRWTSEKLNRTFWLGAGSGEFIIEFDLPPAVADQIGKVHAAATVELDYGMYRLTREQRVDTSPSRFDLAGAGFCSWRETRYSQGLSCAAPLRLPGILIARMSGADSTCMPDSSGPIPPDRYAVAAQFESRSWLESLDIDPVRRPTLIFGEWLPHIHRRDDQVLSALLCRGTPITVQTGYLESERQSAFALGALGSEKIVTLPESGTVRFRIN